MLKNIIRGNKIFKNKSKKGGWGACYIRCHERRKNSQFSGEKKPKHFSLEKKIKN